MRTLSASRARVDLFKLLSSGEKVRIVSREGTSYLISEKEIEAATEGAKKQKTKALA